MKQEKPPVVAVLGHVDHGKTTLLDSIRKTDIAAREVGQITQGIGASTVPVSLGREIRKITFIDTPGHEAFIAMRSRGTSAADIAVLAVAINEGVKPQTKEAISLIKESKIPFIVALTKSDLPDKNPSRVKQELASSGISLEGMGGEVPVVEVSAKTGIGVKELLELILLVWDMQEKKEKKKEDSEFMAVVIESRLDSRKGPLVTVVIKSGELKVREEVFIGDEKSKIRAIFDIQKRQVLLAKNGEAVEVLGFSSLPHPGEIVFKERKVEGKPLGEDQEKPKEEGEPSLSLVLKADSLGSLEAILNLLPKEVLVIAKGSGEVTEGDVILAKANKAIIVGFNTRVSHSVVKLADIEHVLIKKYNLIYELLTELKDVVEGIKTGERKIETQLGRAQILTSFPYDKKKVLGVKIVEGRVALGDKIRLMRGEEDKGQAKILSMRRQKEDIKRADQGTECGLILEPSLDFEVGDMLLSSKA